MNVSEVLEVEGSFESKPLKEGDKITIQKFNVKHVPKYDVDNVKCYIAEIETTEGKRHSFAKTIVGQADSDHWKVLVAKCVEKDASDGLDTIVETRIAQPSGRPMLALSFDNDGKQQVEKSIPA